MHDIVSVYTLTSHLQYRSISGNAGTKHYISGKWRIQAVQHGYSHGPFSVIHWRI